MISIRFNYLWSLLLISGILSSCIFEEDGAPEPSEVYVKYFGSSGSQEITDMIVNSEGNVVILGDQTLVSTGDRNVVIIEADSIGNQIRSRSLDVATTFTAAYNPDSTQTSEFSKSIKEISSGYLITGTYAELEGGQTQQFNVFWAVVPKVFDGEPAPPIKIDSIRAGDYEPVGANANHVFANDIIESSDGNVIIVGKTDLKEENDETPNAGEQIFVIKRDFNVDTTIWRRSYGFPNSDDEARAVFELNDGNIAVIGSSSNHLGADGVSGANVEIVIFNDLASSPVTAGTYGVSIGGDNSASDQPNDVIKVFGGFVIVGTSTAGLVQRPFLMGVLESADIVYGTALESVHGINAQGNSVTASRENDLIVIGTYPDFLVTTPEVPENARDKNGEILFMRTGQSGVIREGFENNFGLVSGDDIGKIARTLTDGSIMVGATVDFGSNQTMIALMKMNDSGVLQRQ